MSAVPFVTPNTATNTTPAVLMGYQQRWVPVMDPLVAPLRKLFSDAKAQGLTAGQLLDRLAEHLPDMNADPLAESLSRVAMAARLAGDAGIDNE